MMYQIVFQITTEIGWWKVNLDSFFRIVLLNEFQWWYKVAVGTNKDNCVSSIQNAVSYHSYGNVYIRFLFFRARNGVMAVRTLYLFFKILATNDFKAFSIEKPVGIEKSTLTTAFFRV